MGKTINAYPVTFTAIQRVKVPKCSRLEQDKRQRQNLAHLLMDKKAAGLADDIAKYISWMNVIAFWSKFHWNLFPGI